MSLWSATRVKAGGIALVIVGVSIAFGFARCGSDTEGSAPDRGSAASNGRRSFGGYAPYHNEHGDYTPRARSDPKNARIRGCVHRARVPVVGVKVVATAWPHGMSWTTDDAVTGADGCYEIVVTAKYFLSRQVIGLEVDGGQMFADNPNHGLVGKLQVEAEPGRTTEHADIEAGLGFWIRGVVHDANGDPVAGVYVGDNDGCHCEPSRHADAEGRFALRVEAVGRHRLLVSGYDQASPVMFDVERLDGHIDGATLTIEERPDVASSHERELPGAARFRIKPIVVRSGVSPPAFIWCTAWARSGDGKLYPTVTQSEFKIDLRSDTVRITCDEMNGFADNGRDIDPATAKSPIELSVVPVAANGVDLGVELRPHPSGALVTATAAEAQAAGLRAGDVIVAVDGISVAGFLPESVNELGFDVPPGHEVTWTIERGGARMTLHARAPGALKPALYIYQ